MHRGGVSCEVLGYYLALAQLQRTGQAPVRVFGLQWGVGMEGVCRNLGSWLQQTQISMGKKTDEICRASTAAVLASGLNGESFWGCPHNM